ncbi:MAG: ATP-binding cassette domain-containing protein, partial [Acetobacteraceae bacterium]
MSGAADLVEAKALRKYFPIRKGLMGRITAHLKAVDGVDFAVRRGEVLGLVGESGSGKSTVGRLVLRLIEPSAGEIRFDGISLTHLNQPKLRRMRRRMQMIFQDPYSSLNPRMTVGEAIADALRTHGLA